MNDPTTIVINLRACKPRSVRDLASVSAAIELIEHMVEAGRLVRVAGEGPARWEWAEKEGGR